MNRTFLCVLLAALVTACSSSPEPSASPTEPLPGEGWIKNTIEDTTLFLATDNRLAKSVDISNVATYSTHDNDLKATCQFRNVTDKPVAIQLRAIFRKLDGTTLEESAWQTITLPPAKYIPFEAVNESGQAARVMVEMRLKD